MFLLIKQKVFPHFSTAMINLVWVQIINILDRLSENNIRKGYVAQLSVDHKVYTVLNVYTVWSLRKQPKHTVRSEGEVCCNRAVKSDLSTNKTSDEHTALPTDRLINSQTSWQQEKRLYNRWGGEWQTAMS